MAGAAATPGPLPTRAVAWLDRGAVCWAALGGAMVLYAALVLYAGRDTTLYVDEAFLFETSRGLQPASLLEPLNGHLVAAVRLLYAGVFETFGASFAALQVAQALAGATVVGLLFELMRRRIGFAAALAPALLMLFLGSTWEANFIVSGLTNTLSVGFGLAALLALEPVADGGRGRRDLIACALLTAAIAAWTFGVAMALGIAVLILLQPERRRRLWVFAVPLAAYGAWAIWLYGVRAPEEGGAAQFDALNVLLVPNFLASEAAAVAGAVAGLNFDFTSESSFAALATESQFGAPLAMLAIGILVLRLRRGGARPQLWALIAALLAFWVALALSFGLGRNPTVVRYVYPGAVIAFLIAAEAAAGWRPSRPALMALFGLCVLALGANLYRLDQGAAFYRTNATNLRAEITGLELARDRVDPGFTLSGGLATVHAGPYLESVERNGSPAYSIEELSAQPDERRTRTDSVLIAALGIGLEPIAPSDAGGECETLGANAAEVSFEVAPPGATLRSRGEATLALRRFADTSTVEIGDLKPRTPAGLRIPADASGQPWRASLTPPRRIEVCR